MQTKIYALRIPFPGRRKREWTAGVTDRDVQEDWEVLNLSLVPRAVRDFALSLPPCHVGHVELLGERPASALGERHTIPGDSDFYLQKVWSRYGFARVTQAGPCGVGAVIRSCWSVFLVGVLLGA